MIAYLLLFYLIFGMSVLMGSMCLADRGLSQSASVMDLRNYPGKSACADRSSMRMSDIFDRFADRQFYEDWWNATSWDEFSRKWNKPVHTFLLRHVYASSISSYKLSRQSAMFVTFLLSAAVHELVMAIVTKKIRCVLRTPMLALTHAAAL